jgi:2-oxoglutarate dehydrogenase E1 component
MLLPHGWEGQGPEHSSARLERWLMMAANENYQVIQPSTPAQHFHALRRQVVRSWRKPMFVLTPKSLLRHTAVVSPLEEFVEGRFRRVISDQRPAECQAETSRILLCSGKIYYDLVEARQQRERQDVAIIRLEQFYPLPVRELNAALAAYSVDIPVVWIQQEPANMGAWQFLRMHWDEAVDAHRPLRYIARPAASSPASGSKRVHMMEEERLVEAAFALDIRAWKASRPPETEDILR